MKKLLVLALTATIASAPAFAKTSHYNTATNSTPTVDLSFAFDDTQNLQAVVMTDKQMTETEGAVAPLVAVGVIYGGRFVAQRWVSQKVAVQIARKGSGELIQAQTRQQARQIARAAANHPKGIRKEFHEPKPSAPTQYKHYHPSKSNGSHIIYGNPRKY